MLTLTRSQQLLYYIIKKMGELEDKTKLAKLEYFIDFIHFAFHDKPISQEEIAYTREKQGPLAINFNDDLRALKTMGCIEENPQYHFKTAKECSVSFDSEELKTIDYVLGKYGKESYRDLVQISHSQAPYLSTKEGNVVKFFTAYNLVDEYADYAS